MCDRRYRLSILLKEFRPLFERFLNINPSPSRIDPESLHQTPRNRLRIGAQTKLRPDQSRRGVKKEEAVQIGNGKNQTAGNGEFPNVWLGRFQTCQNDPRGAGWQPVNNLWPIGNRPPRVGTDLRDQATALSDPTE